MWGRRASVASALPLGPQEERRGGGGGCAGRAGVRLVTPVWATWHLEHEWHVACGNHKTSANGSSLPAVCAPLLILLSTRDAAACSASVVFSNLLNALSLAT